MKLPLSLSGLFGRRSGAVLVLGAGGARGLAHLGVLEVLEEEGIPVSAIVGSSAGSVVGAMWLALGSVAAVKKRWNEFLESDLAAALPDVRLSDRVTSRDNALLLFARRIQRDASVILALDRRGLVEPDEFSRALDFLLPETAIERLPLPLGVVVTDFHTGNPVLMSRGPLRELVAASCAVPGFVPPVIVNGRALIDGGVAAEVPVAEARRLHAGPVIAVDVGDRPGPDDPETITIPRALMRATLITGMHLRRFLVAEVELLLQPDIGHIHWSEFSRLDEALAAGRTAANAARRRLRAVTRGAAPSRFPGVAASPEQA